MVTVGSEQIVEECLLHLVVKRRNSFINEPESSSFTLVFDLFFAHLHFLFFSHDNVLK